jgi:hypothetical protein
MYDCMQAILSLAVCMRYEARTPAKAVAVRTDFRKLFGKISVHLGFLWLQIKPNAGEVDNCFEVLAISIASNSPFNLHDLAIDSSGHCNRVTVDAVDEHIGQTLPDCRGRLLHRGKLGVDHSTVPFQEEFLYWLRIGMSP